MKEGWFEKKSSDKSVRHPALLFAGAALNKMEYIKLWEALPPLPATKEGLRNFPIREPVLWLD